MQTQQLNQVPVFDEVPNITSTGHPPPPPPPPAPPTVGPAIALHPSEGSTHDSEMSTTPVNAGAYQYQALQPAQAPPQATDTSTMNLGYRAGYQHTPNHGLPGMAQGAGHGYAGFNMDPASATFSTGGRGGTTAESIKFCPCGTPSGNTIRLYGSERAMTFPYVCEYRSQLLYQAVG